MRKYLIQVILLLSLLILNISFKCGINSIKSPKIQLISPIEEDSNNLKLRRIEPRNIQIYFDYEILENQVSKNITSQQYLNIIKSAFEYANDIFKKILIVKNPEKFSITKKMIDNVALDFSGNDVPNLIKISGSSEIDLYLVPYITDLSDGVDAAAYAMYLAAKTYRPVLGAIMLKKYYNLKGINIIRFLGMLFLHEISHVLGFSNSLFNYFQGIKYPITKAIINGVERTLLKTPKVLEYARGHFGCPSLGGVELENQGGDGSAGSHWESRIMLGDYMISTDYPEIVISDITLAVFEDSGWYSVNYYTGGLFKTGKAEGCDFLQTTCIDKNKSETRFPLDFCDSDSHSTCSPGYLDKGYCKLYGWEPADYCPISYSYSGRGWSFASRCDEYASKDYGNYFFTDIENNFEQKYGKTSFCFQSNLIKNTTKIEIDYFLALCYEIKECNKDSLSYTIGISSSENFTCLNATSRQIYSIENYLGRIVCPPYWRICGGTEICNDPYECAMQSVKTQILDTQDYVLNKTNYNPVYTMKDSSSFIFYKFLMMMIIIIFILL